ncbi:glycoside hydrolase family 172 protein [Haoranjiania flava]|uniref:DUF2961 domain-containing protein n=1 Tax=Haoranjiania flava TaxID=1856322 RepID=A0AAE3LLG8_9BACT|nr:glycoside hydrolase family 172 protein [Haoranjiania flava]MCU7695384.1 DUF2961 domain-containing protein [Haoranjiania flava]
MSTNNLSRRKALAALGSLGIATGLPFAAGAANTIAQAGEEHLYDINNHVSGQLTTFDYKTKEKAIDVHPGQKVTLAQYDQPGIITRLWMTCAGWFWEHWDVSKEKHPDQKILKKLILRIYWDGNSFPSVEAPIGDFFGIGLCEYKHYLSKYLGMSSGGFYCYLPMPFNKIRIEIENLHDTRASAVFLNANFTKLSSLPKNSGRLHCLYNAGTNPGSTPMTIMKTKGKGHFVGCCISMQSFLPNYLGYLEAPEYIYIDTEDRSVPSMVGTGLEDYFNGGWYFRDGEFWGPYHGVPLKDGFRSMISMYRFHENDKIYFNKSCEIEFTNPRPPEHTREFKFSSTAYWYQQTAVPLAFQLPSKNKLVDWYRIRDTDHQAIP